MHRMFILASARLQRCRRLLIALVLFALPACVSVEYARPGPSVDPRPGETLVFGRVRFFHDQREFFPWGLEPFPTGVETNTERHLWLLRLGRRAVSAEVHPDEDGSLAIWLAPGDYALVGSTERLSSGAAAYEAVALLRVPAGAVAAYAGELLMNTRTREGWYVSYGGFGEKTVEVQPIEVARTVVEQRLGALPEPPVSSPWCTGKDLPAFNDPELFDHARELLDRGCPATR